MSYVETIERPLRCFLCIGAVENFKVAVQWVNRASKLIRLPNWNSLLPFCVYLWKIVHEFASSGASSMVEVTATETLLYLPIVDAAYVRMREPIRSLP